MAPTVCGASTLSVVPRGMLMSAPIAFGLAPPDHLAEFDQEPLVEFQETPVTPAQVGSTRSSSALTLGTVALPWRNKKLPTELPALSRSGPEELVRLAVGMALEAKLDLSGLIHICAVSSVVFAELKV